MLPLSMAGRSCPGLPVQQQIILHLEVALYPLERCRHDLLGLHWLYTLPNKHARLNFTAIACLMLSFRSNRYQPSHPCVSLVVSSVVFGNALYFPICFHRYPAFPIIPPLFYRMEHSSPQIVILFVLIVTPSPIVLRRSRVLRSSQSILIVVS